MDTLDNLNGDGRQDPAVDRNAVVADLADQIRDAVRTGDRWRPDYAELMAATGRKRSWCEKVVRSARNAVLEVPARTGVDSHTGVIRGRHLTPSIASPASQPRPTYLSRDGEQATSYSTDTVVTARLSDHGHGRDPAWITQASKAQIADYDRPT